MPTLSREALHERAWTEPMPALATAFGVPASALRQACRDADIPAPGRGHWVRLRAGKPVARAALTPRSPAATQWIRLTPRGLTSAQGRLAELAEPPPDPPAFDEPIEAVRARVAERVAHVAFRPTLDRACAAIRPLLAEDAWRRAQKAAVRKQAGWEGPLFDSPFEARRLYLLNSLALGLARAGATLELRDKAARELAARVGTQRVAFTLDAPWALPDLRGDWATRPGPVGPLALKIQPKFVSAGATGDWLDREDATLETQLTDIVVSLLVTAEVQYRAAVVAGHARRIARRAEDAAYLARRRADAERRGDEREIMKADARRERLHAQARDWRTARDIRGFVTEVFAKIDGLQDDGGDLSTWRAWALAEADGLDPARNGSLAPWRAEDDGDIERPCGCGFKCERGCGCGLRMACTCDCGGRDEGDDDGWLCFPGS